MSITEEQSEAIGQATKAAYDAIEVEAISIIAIALMDDSIGESDVYSWVLWMIGNHAKDIEAAVSLDCSILGISLKDDMNGAEKPPEQARDVLDGAKSEADKTKGAILRRLEKMNRSIAQNAAQAYTRTKAEAW